MKTVICIVGMALAVSGCATTDEYDIEMDTGAFEASDKFVMIAADCPDATREDRVGCASGQRNSTGCCLDEGSNYRWEYTIDGQRVSTSQCSAMGGQWATCGACENEATVMLGGQMCTDDGPTGRVVAFTY